MRSLRARLLAWLLGGVLAVGAIGGFSVYRNALAEASEFFDYHLRQTALLCQPVLRGELQRSFFLRFRIQFCGEPANGGVFKEPGNGDLAFKRRLQLVAQSREKQRASTDIEEVVVQPVCSRSEDVRPNRDDGALRSIGGFRDLR